MKRLVVFLVSLFFMATVVSQSTNCIQLKGSNTSGKYKAVNLDSRNIGAGDSSQTEIVSAAWTCNAMGSPICNFRNLIWYDVSEVPTTAIITSAKLYLYAKTNALNGNPGNPTFGSDNQSFLQKVTGTWAPGVTGWNNQPSVTTASQKLLPQSTSTRQNYVIDVTDFVQDWVSTPNNNNGVLLRLVTEQYYNSMIFNSGQAPDSLKPTLEICYTVPTPCNNVTVSGGNGSITVGGLSSPVSMVQVSNATWATVYSQVYNNAPGTITVPSLPPGTYFVKINLFTAGWQGICEKEVYNVIVGGTGQPSLSVSDLSVSENAGTASIRVCLSQASAQNISFSYTTTNGSAVSGSDFTARSGTISIPAGSLCIDIPVSISDDAVAEATESFGLTINNPVGADISRSTATVTILDNDQVGSPCSPITFSTNGSSIVVNNLNASVALVQVSNSSWATVFSQVFNNINGSVNIPTNSSGQYFVRINLFTANWEPICEKTEYVTVSVTQPIPTISIFDTSVNELSGMANVRLCLSFPSSQAVTVQYLTGGQTAVPGSDFTTVSGTATIPAGQTCATINVPILNDNLPESLERFTITLSNPTNATLGASIATVTISDDDQCPAGTICITNTCPATVVNLNTAYAVQNLPAGTSISWHTGTPATNANKLTALQATQVSTGGTYYAAVFIAGANCYSATVPVVVTINSCVSGTIANRKLNPAFESGALEIGVNPNPFSSTIQVNLQSTKEEKVELTLIDLYGKLIVSKSVMLKPGKNQVYFNDLDKLAAGSYLLRMISTKGTEAIRLVKSAK